MPCLPLVGLLLAAPASGQDGTFGALRDPTPGVSLAASPFIADRLTAKASLPTVLDNRSLLGPAKNQGSCGSCVVFASHGLLEAAIMREYGQFGARAGETLLAEQLTVDCLADAYPNLCRTGSHASTVLQQMALDGTAASSIPYIAWKGYVPQTAACTAWTQQLKSSSTAQYPFVPLTSRKYLVGTLTEIKTAISIYGAAVVTMYWTDTTTTNGQGVRTFGKCSAPGADGCGGHAVLLVGWDDSRQAFLIRNSWGTAKGDNGYYYIAYSEFESAGSYSQFARYDAVDGGGAGVWVIEGRVAYPADWAPGAPDATKRVLGVSRLGDGKGVVTSNVGGISCGVACLAKYNVGQSVTLSATADAGSRFKSWSGPCAAVAAPTCSVTMAADQTIYATFEPTTIAVEPGLASVLGATLSTKLAQAVPVNATSAQKSVYAADATLIDRYSLTPGEPTLIVDPSFTAGPSISAGQYLDFKNTDKMVVRIKRLQIDYDWLASGAVVQLVVKAPVYSAAALAGAAGATGGNGASQGKASGGQDGARGGNGAPGGNGNPGGTRQYRRFVLVVDSVTDPVGREIPAGKLTVRYELPGADGGRGGNGGLGGNGGRGGDGGDGSSGIFGCNYGPGNGGPGGTAGNGGNGGSGGDAGFGARILTVGSVPVQPFIASFFGNVNPGAPGLGGLPGLPGQPGAGGARGARPGFCTGGGSDGPPGGVATQNSLGGQPGRAGAIGSYDYLLLKPAAAAAAAGFAAELDPGVDVSRLTLTELGATGAALSWINGPMNTGPMVVESLAGGKWTPLASLGAGTKATTLNGLAPRTIYDLRIRQVSDAAAAKAAYVSFVTVGAAANYQGLWWNPAESGWGINFAHQGDIIFATWFTYDAAGKPWWLIAELRQGANGVYSGLISTVTGPPFNAAPWDVSRVVESSIGTMIVTFTAADKATLVYNLNGITQTKSITRQAFGPLPVCIWGGEPNLALATNYQDLWWRSPAGSESGWGINLSHQGDIIFATWFTYDTNGKPWWLIAEFHRTGPGAYAGNVSTVTGPPFNTQPWDTSRVVETIVGNATLVFANGNSASLQYTVNGVAQTKQITRQVFAGTGTACR